MIRRRPPLPADPRGPIPPVMSHGSRHRRRAILPLAAGALLVLAGCDRSAAYAARYVAKNVVKAGLASKCEVAVSYAIGVAEPTSIWVETFGTGKVEDERLTQLIREHFDLRPYGILTMLDLQRPIYAPTAAYGHFGREDIDLPWERTDKAEALAKDAGLQAA